MGASVDFFHIVNHLISFIWLIFFYISFHIIFPVIRVFLFGDIFLTSSSSLYTCWRFLVVIFSLFYVLLLVFSSGKSFTSFYVIDPIFIRFHFSVIFISNVSTFFNFVNLFRDWFVFLYVFLLHLHLIFFFIFTCRFLYTTYIFFLIHTRLHSTYNFFPFCLQRTSQHLQLFFIFTSTHNVLHSIYNFFPFYLQRCS